MLPTVKAFTSQKVLLAEAPTNTNDDLFAGKPEKSPFGDKKPKGPSDSDFESDKKEIPIKKDEKSSSKEKSKEKQEVSPPEENVLKGRTEIQVLQDGAKVCKEIEEIARKNSLETSSVYERVEGLLKGRQETSIKNLIGKWCPETVKQEGKISSHLSRITQNVDDVLSTWAALMSEKKQQATMIRDILRKLETPQWQLPVWLESLITGHTAENIEKQRSKIYNEARSSFLKSKLPLNKSQKRSLADRLTPEVARISLPIINNLFSDKVIKDCNRNYKGIKTKIDRLLMNLSIDDLDERADGFFDENNVPDDRRKDVAEKIKDILEKQYGASYTKTGVSGERAISELVEIYIRNNTNFKNRSQSIFEDNDYIEAKLFNRRLIKATAKLRKILGEEASTTPQASPQNASTPEGVKAEEPPVRNAPPQQLVQAVQEIEKLFKSIREDIIRASTEALGKCYDRKEYIPSLHALGYLWMKKHQEGSTQKQLGIASSTRQGDGERLATIFDVHTGLAIKGFLLLAEYAKIADAQLLVAVGDLYKLIGDEESLEAKKAIEEAHKDPSEEEEKPQEKPEEKPENQKSEEKLENQKSEETKLEEPSTQLYKGMSEEDFNKTISQKTGKDVEIPKNIDIGIGVIDQIIKGYTEFWKAKPSDIQTRFKAVREMIGGIPPLFKIKDAWKRMLEMEKPAEISSTQKPPPKTSSIKSFVRKIEGAWPDNSILKPKRRESIGKWMGSVKDVLGALAKGDSSIYSDALIQFEDLLSQIPKVFELPEDIDASDPNALEQHLQELEKRYIKKEEETNTDPIGTKENIEAVNKIVVPKIVSAFIERLNRSQTATGKVYDLNDFSTLLKDEDLSLSFPEWTKEAREKLEQAKTDEERKVLLSEIEKKSEIKAEEFLEKKIASKVDFVKAKLKIAEEEKEKIKSLQELAAKHLLDSPEDFLKVITEEENKKPLNPKDLNDKAIASGQPKEGSQSLTKPNETEADAVKREKNITSSKTSLVNRLMHLRKVQRATTIKRMSGTLGVHNGR